MRIVGLLTVFFVLLLGVTIAPGMSAAQTTIITQTAPPPTTVVVTPQPVPTSRYEGEVWTWDSERNIVTLFDYSSKPFRVLITPDQIARLRLHENAVVTGQLLAPDTIGSVMVVSGPMTAVPSGATSSAQINGQVAAIDPNGVAVIESARGPMRVWVADGAQTRFSAGRPVQLHVSVQPVRMVAVSGSGGQASGPTMTVSPSIPGDSAVAIGRVLGISPTGALTVESSRGPITVWVPDAANFHVGDYVQVHTIVASS